jgi:predicted DsbA family dithiol-disulfide isomerase
MSSEARAPAALSIDVVSDVACPWCLIGVQHLEAALAQRPSIDAKITYHPFLLEPDAPRDGIDLRVRLRQKYGGDPAPLFRRVEAAGRAAGLPLDFEKVHVAPDTIGAHLLIAAAEPRGTQRALARALFEAYFLDGRNVGAPEILVEIATKHGFEADEIVALISDEQARTRLKEEARAIAAQGVNGVPFFVFGEKLALSGAQPVAVFLDALDRLIAT